VYLATSVCDFSVEEVECVAGRQRRFTALKLCLSNGLTRVLNIRPHRESVPRFNGTLRGLVMPGVLGFLQNLFQMIRATGMESDSQRRHLALASAIRSEIFTSFP
jgi:hypothetical protein